MKTKKQTENQTPKRVSAVRRSKSGFLINIEIKEQDFIDLHYQVHEDLKKFIETNKTGTINDQIAHRIYDIIYEHIKKNSSNYGLVAMIKKENKKA